MRQSRLRILRLVSESKQLHIVILAAIPISKSVAALPWQMSTPSATNDQLLQRFVVCQECGFARQGQAQLAQVISHLFADVDCIVQELNAA